MAQLTIRLSKEEERLIRNYCKINNISLNRLFKKTFAEVLEDQDDYEWALKAVERFKKNPKTYTHEEVMKMCNLDSEE